MLFNIGINENVKNNIVTLAENKGITKCGTYFSFFVLQALKNSGEKRACFKAMRDKGAWLNMLSEGATTTFEAWGKAQKKNCSLFSSLVLLPYFDTLRHVSFAIIYIRLMPGSYFWHNIYQRNGGM